MSLTGTFRRLLPNSSTALQRRLPKTSLVEKLIPQQPQTDTANPLAEQVGEWQEVLSGFYQDQQVSLVKGLQKTYQQVCNPRTELRARRTRQWLQRERTNQAKRGSFGVTEQEVNRSLLVAMSVVALDLFGSLVFPPVRVLTVPLILVATYPIFKVTWFHLRRHHRPNVGFVVCLTVIASIATGYYTLSIINGLINQLALKLQFRIQDDSQSRLVDVFKQQSHFVYTLIDGVEIRTPFANVRRDDIIVVHTGEMVPVDGMIVQGSASIDQHLLTGESQPAEKGIGDEVFASTMVLTGWIHIRAEKAGEETMVAQIGQILHKTISDKTDVQLQADKMANETVLPTLALGLIILPILGPMAAVSVVVAHFGMRMSIVAPIVVLNYFRLLSQHQILVKDGRTLDLLRDIDTVVFDKTGTLTIHQPHVGRIYTWNGATEDDVLAWAAAAEHKQSHPIALAIVEAAETRHLAIPEVSKTAYEVGYGLTVTVGPKQIKVGSYRFMQQAHISINPDIHAAEEAAHQQGHSLVLVARDNEIIGAIELVPTIRPEANAVIAGLRQRGIQHITIISGDREAPTRKLAHDLGMDGYFAETLPQNKAEIIDQLQQQGRSVCFVGDGINDAIALKKAHVSVSLRGASTVATDTAQIVLLDEGLEHLCQLFDFAHDFDRTMKTCFGLVVAPSLVGMGGVLFLGYGLPQAIWFKQLSLILGVSGSMGPLARAVFWSPQAPLLATPEQPALPNAKATEQTLNNCPKQ
ncbi:MAG: heavy metal translocating P-type ATPase [Chloroflexaceae bacterium]|nr:heavy metal translocating P-type ATPase [Chloroflexaceae bacterium]